MTKLRVLTAASVSVLRNVAGSQPAQFLGKADALEGIEGLELFETPIDFRYSELTPGEQTEHDIENALTLFKTMPSLTPAQAADERLWVTLTLGRYWEYATSRFPISAVGLFGRQRKGETRSVADRLAEAQQNWIKEHYFAGSPRIRLRGNAVSRLWWVAHYSSGFEGYSTEEVMTRLMGKSQDLMRTLVFDRPWIASSPQLARAVIEILMNDTGFDSLPGEKRRHGFRDFVMQIDLLAGRRVLSFLSTEELVKELQPIYAASMKAAP